MYMYMVHIRLRHDDIISQERLTIDSLHVDFDEVDPADINGKYSHKVYGYLLPPQPGTYITSHFALLWSIYMYIHIP